MKLALFALLITLTGCAEVYSGPPRFYRYGGSSGFYNFDRPSWAAH